MKKKYIFPGSFFLSFAFSLCLIFSPFFSLSIAHADINKQINYQGKLTNSSNIAVASSTYNMEFKLYTAPTGGTAIWTETRTGASKVAVTNGLFSVMLGEVNPLDSVNFNQTLYLGVNIGGTGSPVWDGEMTPRKKLGSVPSAIEAYNLGGASSTQYARTDQANIISATSSSAIVAIIQNGTGPGLSVSGGTSLQNASTTNLSVSGNSNLGTVASGVWNGTAIASTFGGTGQTTYATGDFLYASAANTLSKRTIGNSGDVLTVSGGVPTWAATSSLGFASASIATGLTTNFITKWNGSKFADSILFDNGTNVGIGTTTSSAKLAVTGVINSNDGAASGVAYGFFGSPNTGLFRDISGNVALSVVGNEVMFVTGGGNMQVGAVRASSLGASSSPSFSNSSSANTGMFFPTSTQLGFSTAGAERLRIDASGNVGIGTTTPSTKFQITGTKTLNIDTEANGGTAVAVSASSLSTTLQLISTAFTEMRAASGIRFMDNSNNEYMRMTSSGNFGIGTSSPVAKLDVWGNVNVGTSSTPVFFVNTATGRVGIGSNSPSAKLDVQGTVNFGSPGSVNGDLSVANAITVAGGTSGNTTLTLTNGGTSGLSSFNIGNTGTSGNNWSILVGGNGVNGGGGTGVNEGNFVIKNVTDGLSRFIIAKGTGNVAIGTALPTERLNVAGNAIFTGVIGVGGMGTTSAALSLGGNQFISTDASGNAGIFFFRDGAYATTSGYYIRYRDPVRTPGGLNTLAFGVSGADKMTLDSSGNLGIGTTTPSSKLSVIGDVNLTGALNFSGNPGTAGQILQTTGTTDQWVSTSTLGFLSSAITTSLTTNFVPKWNGSSFVNSKLFDNGTNVGIGSTSPDSLLTVQASATNAGAAGGLNLSNSAISHYVFVDSAGYLNISRNNNPSTPSILIGQGNDELYIRSTTSGGASFTASGADVVLNAIGSTNSLNFNTNSVNRMRIDAATGNIGIGTTTSGAKLGVLANGDAVTGYSSTSFGPAFALDARSNGGRYWRLISSGTSESEGSGKFMLNDASGGGTRFVIDASGNVGVGTTTPLQRLTVDGNFLLNPIADQSGGALFAYNFASDAGYTLTTRGAKPLFFGTGNTQRMVVDTTGNVGIGTTSPSELLTLNNNINNATGASLGVVNGNTGSAAASRITAGENIVTGKNVGLYYLNSGYTASGTNLPNSGLLVAQSGATNGLVLRTDASAPIIFATAGAGNERMRIDSAGNVGIGTTTPINKLDVVGIIRATNAISIDTGAGGNANADLNLVGRLGGVANSVLIRANFNGGLVINPTADVTIGAASPNNGNKLNVTGKVSIGSTYAAIAAPANGLLVEGNVGIGTTTPGSLLTVAGSMDVTGSTVFRSGATFNTAATFAGTGNNNNVQISGQGGNGTNPLIQFSGSASKAYVGYGNIGGTGVLKFTSGGNFIFGSETDNGNTLQVAGTGYFSGNVGIGTTTPDQKLTVLGNVHVAGGGSGNIFLDTNALIGLSSTNGLQFGGSGLSYKGTNGNIMDIAVGAPTSTLEVTSAGNVGIGTTTPSAALTVIGKNTAFIGIAPLALNVIGGTPSSGGDGGGSQIIGGLSGDGSVGGGLLFKGGASLASGGTGGDVTLGGGQGGNNFGTGGNINITAGNAGTIGSVGGNVLISAGLANSAYGKIILGASGGNVGIGTSSPAYLLTVAGDTNITGALRFNTNPGTLGQILQSNGASAPAWVSTSTLGFASSALTTGLTSTRVPKWNGTKFVDSTLVDTGSLLTTTAILQPNAGINYPNTVSMVDASSNLHYPNGNTMADTSGYIYYGNAGTPLTDGNNLYYGNGDTLADSNGYTYYGQTGATMTDGYSLYYGSGNMLADNGGDLYYGNGNQLSDGADLYSSNTFYNYGAMADVSGSTGSANQILTTTGGSVTWKNFSTAMSAGGVAPWLLNGTSAYYNGGNVGIGTSTPGSLLTVAGNVSANQYNALSTSTGYMLNGNSVIRGTFGPGNSLRFGLGGNDGISSDNILIIGTSPNVAKNITSAGSPGSIIIGGLYGGDGRSTAENLTTGRVVLIGNHAGTYISTGTSNDGVGRYALSGSSTNMLTGGNNVAFGDYSLGSIAGSSQFNTAVGDSAGNSQGAGSENTYIGFLTGANNTSGSNNTFLGSRAGPAVAGSALSNATAIGYSAQVGTSNSLVLGGIGANAVNVGIGTSTPDFRLTVAGGGIILDNNQYYQGRRTNNSNVNLLGFTSAGYTTIGDTSSSAVITLNSGSVGIGTTTPGSTLTVNGGATIISTLNLGDPIHQGYLKLYNVNGGGVGNIYNDTTNGGLHLDTGSNAYPIQIDGSKVILGMTGNVGIGVTNPGSKLEVNGNIVAGTSTGARIQISNGTGIAEYYTNEASARWMLSRDGITGGVPGLTFIGGGSNTAAANGASIGYPANRSVALFTSNGTSLTERLRVDGSGNVGIGTTTPGAKLAITGTTGIDPFVVASSSNSKLFRVDSNGNAGVNGYLGIGTLNPQAALDIHVSNTNNIASYSDDSLPYTVDTIITDESPAAGYGNNGNGGIAFTSDFNTYVKYGYDTSSWGKIVHENNDGTITNDAGDLVFQGSTVSGGAITLDTTNNDAPIYINPGAGGLSIDNNGNGTNFNGPVQFNGYIYGDASNLSNIHAGNIVSGTANSIPFFNAGGALTMDTTKLAINPSTGSVGVGTSTPGYLFSVQSGAINTTASSDTGFLAVFAGPNRGLVNGSNSGQVAIISNGATPTADAGGSLSFGATYTTSGFDAVQAGIRSGRDNGTSGAYGGYMAFTTRTNGQAMSERMRIDSAGNVGIGTTTPGSKLEVAGTTAIGTNAANYLTLAGSATNPSISVSGLSADADLLLNPKGNGQVLFGGGGYAYNTQASGKASLLFDNGSVDTPNLKFAYGPNLNFAIDSAASGSFGGLSSQFMRFIKNSDETGGAVIGGIDASGNAAFNGTGYFAGTGTFGNVLTVGLAANPSFILSSNYTIPSKMALTLPGIGALQLEANSDRSLNTQGSSRINLSDRLTTFSNVTNAGTVSETMRIDSAGNVGIGTTTLGSKLNVGGTAYFGSTSQYNGTLSIMPTTTNVRALTFYGANYGIGIDTSDLVLWGATGQGVSFKSNDYNGTSLMRILSSGNVGIGTTNPLYKLEVDGAAGSNGVARIGSIDYGTTTVFSVAPGTVNFDAAGIVGGRLSINGGTGNVAIGMTSAATNRLQVQSNTSGAYDGVSYQQTSTTGVGYMGVANAGGNDLKLNIGSASQALRGVNGTGAEADLTSNGASYFSVGTFDAKPLYLTTNNAVRLTVDSSGNMQMGLTANDMHASTFNFKSADSTGTGNRGSILSLGGGAGGTGGGYGALLLQAAGGNVGIGTTTPGYALTVVGNDGSGNVAKFTTGTATSCTLNSTTGLLNCSSDERLKQDITPLDASSTFDKVLSLNPVSYHWKTDVASDTLKYGFIAQQVQAVFPELVETDHDTGYLSLSLNGMIPYLVTSIQQLNSKVSAIVTDGAIHIQSLFAQTINANKVKVSEGFEMKDQATGDTYCVTIVAGQWSKQKGECGSAGGPSEPMGSNANSNSSDNQPYVSSDPVQNTGTSSDSGEGDSSAPSEPTGSSSLNDSDTSGDTSSNSQIPGPTSNVSDAPSTDSGSSDSSSSSGGDSSSGSSDSAPSGN